MNSEILTILVEFPCGLIDNISRVENKHSEAVRALLVCDFGCWRVLECIGAGDAKSGAR